VRQEVKRTPRRWRPRVPGEQGCLWGCVELQAGGHSVSLHTVCPPVSLQTTCPEGADDPQWAHPLTLHSAHAVQAVLPATEHGRALQRGLGCLARGPPVALSAMGSPSAWLPLGDPLPTRSSIHALGSGSTAAWWHSCPGTLHRQPLLKSPAKSTQAPFSGTLASTGATAPSERRKPTARGLIWQERGANEGGGRNTASASVPLCAMGLHTAVRG